MPLAHLVVIVPGIGGSVLERPDGAPLWGQSLPRTVRSAFSPAELAISEPVVPVGLLPSMAVLPWMKVAGYDRLVQRLLTKFELAPADVDTAHPDREPRPDAQVLLFPYDFRRGMAFNAERLGFEIGRRVGDRQVIVVAHSMGGLVARWWWAVLGGHRNCRSLITVGTPHRGAPKALDWLLNGVRVGPVSLTAATDVVAEWDSTWELLPRYPAVWDGTGPVYPHEVSVAPESFRARAKAAYERHQELSAATEPGSRFMAFYATGHATPARAVVSDGRVEVHRVDADWLGGNGWDGGDGTVPAVSATPVEYAADSDEGIYHRTWRPEPHLPMASAAGVVEFVARFEAASLDFVRGEPAPDRPWVAFDVADVTAAGEPSTATIRLCGADPERVTARARLGEWLPVERDGTGWRIALPSLPPGAHRLRVELDHVPEVDRVTGEDVVGVVEP